MATTEVGIPGVRVGVTLGQAMLMAGDVLRCVVRLESLQESPRRLSGDGCSSKGSGASELPHFTPCSVDAVVLQVCGVLSLTRRGDDGNVDPLLAEILASPQQNLYRHIAQQWLVTGPPLEGPFNSVSSRDGSTVESTGRGEGSCADMDAARCSGGSEQGQTGHLLNRGSGGEWSGDSRRFPFCGFERLPSSPPLPPPEGGSWMHEDPAACAVYGQQSKLLFLSEPCLLARNVALPSVCATDGSEQRGGSAVFGFQCNLPPFLPPSHRISGGGGYQYFLTVHVFRQTRASRGGGEETRFLHSVGRVPLWMGGSADAQTPLLLTLGPPLLPSASPPAFAAGKSLETSEFCRVDSQRRVAPSRPKWRLSLDAVSLFKTASPSSAGVSGLLECPEPQPFHFKTRVDSLCRNNAAAEPRATTERRTGPSVDLASAQGRLPLGDLQKRQKVEGEGEVPEEDKVAAPLPLESSLRLWALGECVMAFDKALVDAMLSASVLKSPSLSREFKRPPTDSAVENEAEEKDASAFGKCESSATDRETQSSLSPQTRPGGGAVCLAEGSGVEDSQQRSSPASLGAASSKLDELEGRQGEGHAGGESEAELWKEFFLLRCLTDGDWGASSPPRVASFRISQEGRVLCVLHLQPSQVIDGRPAMCAGDSLPVWFDFSASSLKTLEVTVALVCTEQPLKPSALQQALLQGPFEVEAVKKKLGTEISAGEQQQHQQQRVLAGEPRGPAVSRLVWVDSECTAYKRTTAVAPYAPSTALPSCETELMRLSYSLVVRFTCPRKQAQQEAAVCGPADWRVKASETLSFVWELPVLVLPADARASELDERLTVSPNAKRLNADEDLSDADPFRSPHSSEESLCEVSALPVGEESPRCALRRLEATCEAALLSGAASRTRRELVL